MEVLWTIIKIYVATNLYNLATDLVISKITIKKIKKDYNENFEIKYNPIGFLTFFPPFDSYKIYCLLKYYDEFKEGLIKNLLKENIISPKETKPQVIINQEKTKDIDKNINYETKNTDQELNNNSQNKPKVKVKKRQR